MGESWKGGGWRGFSEKDRRERDKGRGGWFKRFCVWGVLVTRGICGALGRGTMERERRQPGYARRVSQHDNLEVRTLYFAFFFTHIETKYLDEEKPETKP